MVSPKNVNISCTDLYVSANMLDDADTFNKTTHVSKY